MREQRDTKIYYCITCDKNMTIKNKLRHDKTKSHLKRLNLF